MGFGFFQRMAANAAANSTVATQSTPPDSA